MKRMRLAAMATAAAALTGCASFNPEAGFSPVQRSVQQHAQAELAWPRTPQQAEAVAERTRALLAQPLGQAAAVQVALLNRPALQASLQELLLAEVDAVKAGRPANPGLRVARTRAGDEVEIETGLHLNLARLVAQPWLRALAEQQRQQVQARVAAEALGLAAEVRQAWVQAVAAAQLLSYRQQVLQAAEASAELARRMAQVGNFSPLQRAREQAFQQDAALNLARATQGSLTARERLNRLLGLWGDQLNYTLPERLPDLPTAPLDNPQIEQLAMAQRLDVQAARLLAEQAAAQARMATGGAWVKGLEIGAETSRSNEGHTARTWELGMELPLFDSASLQRTRAEALHAQALQRAADTAIQARSEVRQAYAAYRSSYDIARFQRDERVPLHQRIAEENLLRYNGMLIGVFDLLADARAQIETVHAAIESLRDFWLAQADLDAALVGKPGLMLPASTPAAPAASGGDGH